MLRFFKLNDPYRLIAVLLVLIGLSLPLFISSRALTILELKDLVVGESLGNKILYVQLIDDTPWLAARIDQWAFFLFGHSLLARQLAALFILFFQAAYFTVILIRYRAYNESNYLPALIFGIISFFSFDLLALSPELLASTFLLFALSNLFQEIEFKIQREETVLYVGLYLGMASLFVLSYTVFLPGSLVLLLVYARLSFRKSLFLIFSFCIPHIILIILYFFYDALPQYFQYFYAQNFFTHAVDYISMKSLLVLGSVVLMYLVFSLVMLKREAHFTRYQSQLLQVMLGWLALAGIEVFLTKNFSPRSFISFVPPLAYLISHYLLLIRRKWIAETMLLFFLILIIAVSSAARLKKISQVDYSKLTVPAPAYDSIQGKRIIVLGTDWGLYQTNHPATYFLNWDLSKEYIENAGIFQHIVLINECFEREKPEVIIDESGLMERIFLYNPKLKEVYLKKERLYWRKSV